MQLWCVNLVPRCPHCRKLRKRIKNKQKQNYDHSFALNFLIYKIDSKYAELFHYDCPAYGISLLS